MRESQRIQTFYPASGVLWAGLDFLGAPPVSDAALVESLPAALQSDDLQGGKTEARVEKFCSDIVRQFLYGVHVLALPCLISRYSTAWTTAWTVAANALCAATVQRGHGL